MSRGNNDHALAYGGERADFAIAGCRAFIVRPHAHRMAEVQKWVWFAPTFVGDPRCGDYPTRRHAWLFGELLASGTAVGGIDIGESYGNSEGRRKCTAFYKEVVDSHGFDARPVLLAQSRGALMLYNWASDDRNASKCCGIAGIYPVVNLNSWPPDPESAAAAHKLSRKEFYARIEEFNPVDRLKPLVDARVPLLNIHGDQDTLVPLDANSGELTRRYQALGGHAELVTVAGRGHEEVDEFFRSGVLRDFVVHCASGENEK